MYCKQGVTKNNEKTVAKKGLCFSTPHAKNLSSCGAEIFCGITHNQQGTFKKNGGLITALGPNLLRFLKI
jgi:hypothetical protein